jgi:predicted O-linked N-acetylglucosamine transferase (SPINDLY family)
MDDDGLKDVLAHAQRMLREGRLAEADAGFSRVAEQVPGQVDALLGRARVAAHHGDMRGAADFLRTLLATHPDHAEACFGLAVMCQNQGALEEAAHWYRRVAELRPADAIALYNLGVVRQAQGGLAEAEEAYRRASNLDGGFYQPLINLGNILLQQGRLEAAGENYRRALALQPDSVEALHGLGLVRHRQGRIDDAAEHFQAALSVNPAYAPALFSMGVIHHDRMEPDRAVAWYERALRVQPGQVDVLFNLGKAWQDVGRLADAERVYARLAARVEQAPQGTNGIREDGVFYNLSLVLKKQGKWAAWFDNHRRFGHVAKGSLLWALDGVMVARYLADADGERAHLDTLMSHAYTATETDALRAVLALLPYFDVVQESTLALYRQFDRLMLDKVGHPLASKPPWRSPGTRLRVGYLSPDLRRHVMGHMMLEVIARHDRDAFDIHCYSLSATEDEVTRAIRDNCKRFQIVKGLHPRRAAELIAQDALDILVDLATHTEGAVPEILAYKPARVQITSIASSGAVGLSTIDYRLTDHYCDPPENQRYLIEKLLPMAGCVYPYRTIRPASTHGYSRAALGIAEDAIVIGAFVNIVKLSPRCLSLWRRVMDRVPRSVLAFSPNSERDISAYRSLALGSGIDPSRIVFIPRDPDAAIARARYALVDMVLDTLPYGGVNGTIEALDMGVPVVTLLGSRHGERTSYSILMNLSVTQTIARDENEFIAIAARLVEDGVFRQDVTASIRAGLENSPLVDMDAHVRNLEDAYRLAVAGA